MYGDLQHRRSSNVIILWTSSEISISKRLKIICTKFSPFYMWLAGEIVVNRGESLSVVSNRSGVVVGS